MAVQSDECVVREKDTGARLEMQTPTERMTVTTNDQETGTVKL